MAVSRIETDHAQFECQTWAHWWDDFTPTDRAKPVYKGDWEPLRCMRCGAERHSVYADTSQILVYRRYIYPPGYKYAKGERPDRAAMRQEMFRRWRDARRAFQTREQRDRLSRQVAHVLKP